MEFSDVEVRGFKPAIMFMRNPLKSYHLADSDFNQPDDENFIIGEKDYDLAKRLCVGGDVHRKWMRMVFVWANITMPRYLAQEFDTYQYIPKSTESTMHTLRKQEFDQSNFEFDWDTAPVYATEAMNHMIEALKMARDDMNKAEGEEKTRLLRCIKGMLPEGFSHTRGVCMNYEHLARMYEQRKDHRLKEWNTDFVNWVHTLPYSEFITHEWDGVDTSTE